MTGAFQKLKESMKNAMPQGVHAKLDQIFTYFEQFYTDLGNYAEIIVKNPLIAIYDKLERKDIKPPLAMKHLQDHIDWCKMVSEGINNGVYFEDCLDQTTIEKLRTIFLSEMNAGKAPKLEKLLTQVKMVKIDVADRHPICNDITTSNVIVILSEFVQNTEVLAEELLPGMAQKLQQSQYKELNINEINPNCVWARKMIDEGKAGRVSIIPMLNEKKDLLEKGIELHKIFKPILHDAEVFIETMPIILTLLFDEREGVEKLRNDASNIFNEFSMGAEIERLALSLKEKMGKKRPIEEIKVNADAIQRNFQRLKDSLNQNVLSYVRRMKIRTFIDEKLYDKAIKAGIDLTNLNTPIGAKSAPPEYTQLKMDAMNRISSKIVDYNTLVTKRVAEEMSTGYRPNLHMLDEIIMNIRSFIERSHAAIPPHVAPLYAGSIYFVNESIGQILSLFAEHKNKSLNQITGDENKKVLFYTRIREIYDQLEERYRFFRDLVTAAIKIAFADQQIALHFVDFAGDELHHKNGYQALFDASLSEFRRKKQMKTVNQEEALLYEVKISEAQTEMSDFIAKWPAEILLAIKTFRPQ